MELKDMKELLGEYAAQVPTESDVEEQLYTVCSKKLGDTTQGECCCASLGALCCCGM